MYPNRVALSDDKGYTSIVSIARAKEIGTLQEDFSIGGYKMRWQQERKRSISFLGHIL